MEVLEALVQVISEEEARGKPQTDIEESWGKSQTDIEESWGESQTDIEESWGESQTNIEDQEKEWVWNHLIPIHIGADVSKAGTFSYDIPDTVPSTAETAISNVISACFNRLFPRMKPEHNIKLYTVNKSRRISFEQHILLATAFLNLNSYTMMFPVEADRQIHMDLDRASDDCWMDVRVLGYM